MTVFSWFSLGAAQEHWSCGSADAASAYLQAGRIERLLLLAMSKQQDIPGCGIEEVRVARGSINEAVLGINTFAINLRTNFGWMRALWKCGSTFMSSMVDSLSL